MTARQATSSAPPAATAASSGRSAGYTVLARRYRPRDFDELVGQEPIARTLRNAIETGRTAHAYLFCGTRGVGKTSMARIFAKALNASGDLSEAEAIAEAILRGDDLDVIEIDGASNRGIQEARDLIAAAGLSPARCPYKIYIIDEVHQVTRDAFNALLKTMEEPPRHVKFILCTTEPGKVPATIQSRCQRFDFRPIPSALIAETLKDVLGSEGIGAEDAVVSLVARLGRGSLRDALSLLDRLLAVGEGTLTVELAEQMLGLPDHTLVANVVSAVVAQDPPRTLKAGDELLGRGVTVEQALELLAEHLRVLMVVSACGGDTEILDVTSDAREVAVEQASHFDLPALVHMIATCDGAARAARGSAAGRAIFDATMVRLCLTERFADIATLLQNPDRPGPATTPAGHGRKKKGEATVVPAGAATAVLPREPEPTAVVEIKPADPEEAADEASLWAKVLETAAASPKDQAKVRHLSFESFDGRTLRLAVDAEGARSARFLSTQSESLTDLIRRATGRRIRVHIETPPAAPRPPSSPLFDEARKLPAVQTAIEIFDAVITGSEPAAPGTDRARGAEEEDHV